MPAPPLQDLFSRDFDFGPPSAEPPSHLLATPLDVAVLSAPPKAIRARPPWAPLGARVVSWAADALLLALCAALLLAVAAFVVGTARLAPPGFGSLDYWLDLVAFGPRLPPLWPGSLPAWRSATRGSSPRSAAARPGWRLPASGCRAWAAAQCGRLAALGRAVLALPSAALGLFGFALALFDARGQTLHDKLAGTAVIRDDATLGS